MMKLVVILGFLFFDSPAKLDSLGVETINGKMFIIHKVDEKETLYGLSRRYGTPVESILEYNAGAKAGLEVGLILKIPYTPKQSKALVDGKVHKVAPKETLFSISKLYGVTTEEIKKWNNLPDNNLAVGQEIVIKKSESKADSRSLATISGNSGSSNKGGLHTVAEKETMYSIARQYNITVDQLKQWNNLASTELKIGQSLVVSGATENKGQKTVTTVAQNNKGRDESKGKENSGKEEVKRDQSVVEKKDERKEETRKENQVVQNANKETTTGKEAIKEQPVIKISESVGNGDEILESGVAELIEGTEGNRKYLALHRTAPVGTILKVRNEMNNREVFVRVMGKLPETALTDKVIIRISKSAYDRLGAIDPKFRVEVTYYK
jgi:LysM repeat protein